jgi:hypothetical protein
MLALCQCCTDINHEISKNTDSIHEAGLTSREATHIVAQSSSLLCYSEQLSKLVFCNRRPFMVTYTFALAANKATTRFQLYLKSAVWSVTHFLQSWINNHHAVIRSELDCIISIILSADSQMSSIFSPHKLFFRMHIYWHRSTVKTVIWLAIHMHKGTDELPVYQRVAATTDSRKSEDHDITDKLL